MYILEVIPLISLPSQVPQLLSYFFNRSLPKGSLVEVVIGHRKVPAVVISSSLIEDRKISLKKFGFQLKKISSVISEEPKLGSIQFKIASWLSKNYFTSPGLSFKTVLPAFFLDPKYPFSYPNIESEEGPASTPRLLLSPSKKIVDEIRSEAEKIVRKHQQVLVIVPEISIAKLFYDTLAGYYETAIIHGKIGLKQSYKDWKRISSGEAEVIIGTRQALFAPFSNLGLIIVEDPANEAYKSDMSPKYTTRDLAVKIAEIYSVGILFISQIPDIKSYFLAKNDIYKLEDKRALPNVAIQVENMPQEIKSGNFSIFSRELRNNIQEYAGKNKKILLFSTRKGYSSYLLCGNCGFYPKCPQCAVPLKLHSSPEEMLICHRCFTSQKIPDSCPNCHSYKLKGAGFAGSEKLKEELERVLGSVNVKKEIFLFDSSSLKNLKAEMELVEKMEELDSFVCIATQFVFSHRFNLKFDLVGIPNLDSLTTTPDFKTEEELFMQFEKLLDLEPEKAIIQTFNPESRMLEFLTARNYKDFYESELPARKLFMYPPFARLVKLSFFSADKNKAGYEARILNEKLKMAVIQKKLGDRVKILGPSPAFVEKEKNLHIYNIVLKLSPEFQVNEIVKFVPSGWIIDIDPRSIL